MDLGLKDKVVIITGGASGLGRMTAKYLADEGMKIVLADRDEKNLEVVKAEVEERGAEAATIAIDVRNYDDCVRTRDLALDRFGKVDRLLAGAGIAGENLFINSKPDQWDMMLDINIRGVLNINHAVVPHMVERGEGVIVNIASEAGKIGERFTVVYSATKGAVIGFTKALAVEVARSQVRVNAICPGVTPTPMVTGPRTPENLAKSGKVYPLGRLGQPEEIASVITFLFSDQNSWMTGQAISVNGGFARH